MATDLVGAEAVDIAFLHLIGSEDFAYMHQCSPGALVRIGNGPSDGAHSPSSRARQADFINLQITITDTQHWPGSTPSLYMG